MTLFCLCPYGFIKFNRGENFKINVQINCINFLFCGPSHFERIFGG